MKQLALLIAMLAAPVVGQAELAFDVQDPAFRVSIPNLPAMEMGSHPMRSASPHLRLLGREGPYTVSLLLPTADAGMTAMDCANATVGSLPRRPGVPAADSIYRARLDANTFLAIYVTPMPGFAQMHAHLMSAAGGTHCVEVHASMTSRSRDDLDPWIKGFTAARIEAR